MARVFMNFGAGETSALVSALADTLPSPDLASVPVLASPNFMDVTLDPLARFGAPEVVRFIAHADGALTVTIERGLYGTTQREHPAGTVWRAGTYEADMDAGVSVKMFGAVGKGADETTLMQAAFVAGAGGIIDIPEGTWKITAGLLVVDDDTTIRLAPGAVIDATALPVAAKAISAVGSVGVSTTLTADATPSAAADQVLAVTSSAGFAAGDMVFVTSNAEVFNAERPLQFVKGEAGFVRAVGAGTITLTAALEDSYSTSGYTVTVKKINPVRRFRVFGGRIRLPGAGGQNYGVYTQFFQDALVEGVTVEDAERTGIYFERGVGFRAAFNVVDRSNESGLGYGILGNGAVDGAYVGNTLRECRHGLDISNGVTMPVSRHLVISANTVRDCLSAGISTHGGAEHVVITGNTVVNCGGGIVSRHAGAVIVGNTVLGTKSLAASADSYQHGIWVADVDHGTSPAATDLVVADNIVDLTGATGGCVGIAITPPTNRAIVRGNILRGHDSYGILAQGKTHTDLEIVGNTIDGTGQSGSPNGILVYHHSAAAGDHSRGVLVSGNAVSNSKGDAIRVDGGYDTGNRSSGIAVIGNIVRGTGAGHADINLHNGYYGDGCLVASNVLPDKGTPTNVSSGGAIYWDTSLFSPLPLEFGNVRHGATNFIVSTDAVWMNAAAGVNRDFAWNSDGVGRWTARVTSDAESGSDAGSRWQLIARSDAGSFKKSVMEIPRTHCVPEFLNGICVFPKAGIPVDGDFPAVPPDATFVVDTVNSRIYVRVGGTWKYSALT